MAKKIETYFGESVLITGATGFLGQALASKLWAIGARVSVIVRDVDFNSLFYDDPGSNTLSRLVEKTIVGDLRDYRTIERAIAESQPQCIFHLAAVTQVVDARAMPLQTYDTNIMGTANILEACRNMAPHQIRIVVASSDKAYGHLEEGEIAFEDTPLDPTHPYDVSKASGDLIARSYGRYYGEKVAITRCGNIYGPGDTNWQRIIPGAIRSVFTGDPLLIRSDGTQVREYNYVDDIVEAYLLVGDDLRSMEKRADFGRSWTISDERARLSVFDVVGRVKVSLDFPDIEMHVLEGAKDEGQQISLDSSVIREELGWEPKVPLEIGIQKTAKWMSQYLTAKGLLPTLR